MYCYLMTECEGQNRNIFGSSSVQHFLPIFIFLFYPTTGRYCSFQSMVWDHLEIRGQEVGRGKADKFIQMNLQDLHDFFW